MQGSEFGDLRRVSGFTVLGSRAQDALAPTLAASALSRAKP